MARKRNPNLVYQPIINYRIVKNPKTLFPVNWEEVVGEDRVRYEDEPIFDKNGNYIETRRNVYVTFEDVKFIVRSKNKPSSLSRKLFETLNERKEESSNEYFRK